MPKFAANLSFLFAAVRALVISDVPGDDPAVITSSPTVADPTAAVDALKVPDFHGIDGSEDNAGAFVTPLTLQRAREQGLDIRRFMAANDAIGYFSTLGDLLVTGPTRTNVNDFRALLIGLD